MPIAQFERTILRRLAANRHPDSFVAGATVLLRAEDSPRQSQDIDLFPDTAGTRGVRLELAGALRHRELNEDLDD